ncbi:unnamed protein product [Amoebophrya sp. A120]|nr:unnamed protein product [Amoebophrya sp. A120]|eukprot:GSA120T00015055001.1
MRCRFFVCAESSACDSCEVGVELEEDQTSADVPAVDEYHRTSNSVQSEIETVPKMKLRTRPVLDQDVYLYSPNVAYDIIPDGPPDDVGDHIYLYSPNGAGGGALKSACTGTSEAGLLMSPLDARARNGGGAAEASSDKYPALHADKILVQQEQVANFQPRSSGPPEVVDSKGPLSFMPRIDDSSSILTRMLPSPADSVAVVLDEADTSTVTTTASPGSLRLDDGMSEESPSLAFPEHEKRTKTLEEQYIDAYRELFGDTDLWQEWNKPAETQNDTQREPGTPRGDATKNTPRYSYTPRYGYTPRYNSTTTTFGGISSTRATSNDSSSDKTDQAQDRHDWNKRSRSQGRSRSRSRPSTCAEPHHGNYSLRSMYRSQSSRRSPQRSRGGTASPSEIEQRSRYSCRSQKQRPRTNFRSRSRSRSLSRSRSRGRNCCCEDHFHPGRASETSFSANGGGRAPATSWHKSNQSDERSRGSQYDNHWRGGPLQEQSCWSWRGQKHNSHGWSSENHWRGQKYGQNHNHWRGQKYNFRGWNSENHWRGQKYNFRGWNSQNHWHGQKCNFRGWNSENQWRGQKYNFHGWNSENHWRGRKYNFRGWNSEHHWRGQKCDQYDDHYTQYDEWNSENHYNQYDKHWRGQRYNFHEWNHLSGETSSGFFVENSERPSAQEMNTQTGCMSQASTASGKTFTTETNAFACSLSAGFGERTGLQTNNRRMSSVVTSASTDEQPAGNVLNRRLSGATAAVLERPESNGPRLITPLRGIASGLGLYKINAWKPEGITAHELAELERMTREKMSSLKHDFAVPPGGLRWWETFDEGAPRAAAQLEAKLLEANATRDTVRDTGTTKGTYSRMGMKQYKTAAAAILQDDAPPWGYAKHATLVLAALRFQTPALRKLWSASSEVVRNAGAAAHRIKAAVVPDFLPRYADDLNAAHLNIKTLVTIFVRWEVVSAMACLLEVAEPDQQAAAQQQRRQEQQRARDQKAAEKEAARASLKARREAEKQARLDEKKRKEDEKEAKRLQEIFSGRAEPKTILDIIKRDEWRRQAALGRKGKRRSKCNP